MRIDTFGSKNNPVIVMLVGSFSPGESMKILYERLLDDFYIVVPTYNGHYENSKDFTTRYEEAKQVCKYIMDNNIEKIKMIYGQSMGCEIGMELINQFIQNNIKVEKALFDGGPFIKLSKIYKKIMYFKFKTMVDMFKEKTVDEALDMKIIKKFSHGDPNSLKQALESVIKVSPYITKQSIKNEVECCYTFDFPTMSENMQKNIYFYYGSEEKAYKTCYKGIKKAYPSANYKVFDGYGHITYLGNNLEQYLSDIKEICNIK